MILWLYNLFNRPKMIKCQYCNEIQTIAKGWDKQKCINCGCLMYKYI
jgi:hypothetical protein